MSSGDGCTVVNKGGVFRARLGRYLGDAANGTGNCSRLIHEGRTSGNRLVNESGTSGGVSHSSSQVFECAITSSRGAKELNVAVATTRHRRASRDKTCLACGGIILEP